MEFFIGLHQPSDAEHMPFIPAFISINRIKNRKSSFPVRDWIMDSGAFTTVSTHGGYPDEPEVYASQIKRWSTNGNLLAAVAQDYMCEPHILAITGLTIPDHQRLTIERYDRVTACDCGGVYIMPVLQGYDPSDYVSHIRQYGSKLAHGAWVGVGSVCKRNGRPEAIKDVLRAILAERPDLKLHGFGLKFTAVKDDDIRAMLHTSDSMAWSYAARREGRDANDWQEARDYAEKMKAICSGFRKAESAYSSAESPLPKSDFYTKQEEYQ